MCSSTSGWNIHSSLLLAQVHVTYMLTYLHFYYELKFSQRKVDRCNDKILKYITKIPSYSCFRRKKRKKESQYPKRHIPSGVRKKIQKLRQVIEEQKQLRSKKKRCDKHLKNLQQNDEEMFMTVNEIYESWDSDDKEKLKDDNEYCDIDESNLYDDPVCKTIIQIFQDEGKVKVKKIIGILENEYESIENEYNEVIDEMADLVDTNEDMDGNDNLYEYIDITKWDQIRNANKERKQVQSKKETVKTVIQNLDALDEDEVVPLEDIYTVPKKHVIKKETAEGPAVEKPKHTMDDQEYSLYVKQVIDEKFGDEKQGTVKDLIGLFEGKMENLKETQDKVINHMTDMVEEETTKLEEEMMENDIDEKFDNEQQDGKVKQLIKMYNKQTIDELSKDDSKLVNVGRRNNNTRISKNTGHKEELHTDPTVKNMNTNHEDDSVVMVDNEIHSSLGGPSNEPFMVDNELYDSSME